MTISREEMLHEMGLSPVWVLRDNPGVLRSEQTPPVEAPAVHTAAARVENSPVRIACSPQPSATDRPEQVAGLGWDALQQSVAECRACGLCAERRQTVFGVGNQSADWLFVGEGPGAEEDVAGEPFVGQGGKLLDAMLAAINLDRSENVYIANAVKCHSPENKTPGVAEIGACAPYLKRQIALLQPKIIVLLGRVAVYAVLGEESTLSALRGKPFEYRIGERRIPVVVTYHPAYLLRTLPDKAKAWEDLCRARALLREASAAGLESATDVSI